jgi:HEAT repeat protein
LSAENVEVRRAALRALEGALLRQQQGARAALADQIGAFLSDDDWRVRKDAASVASRSLETADLAPQLARGVLQGDDVGLRNACIEALSIAGTSGERQQMIHRALGALEPEAPHTALKFLCAAWVGGGPFGLGNLSHHARDPDSTTATAALEALARIGGPHAESELSTVLFASGDDVVRLAALEGLLALRARLSAAQLVRLSSQSLFVRPTLRALGFTADPAAIPPLIDRLGDLRLGGVAAGALAQLAESSELRAHLAAGLTALGPSARHRLLALATESHEETARPALLVLLLARDPESLALVGPFAAQNEPGRPLLESLRRFGIDAVGPLLDALGKQDPPAAAWSLEAAVELAASADADLTARIRSALREAVGSAHEGLKVAALRGLSRFGEAEDAAGLVTLGAHGGSQVARAASDAITALSTAAPRALGEALEGRALEGNDAPLAWSKAVRALPRALALEKLSEAAAGEDARARQAAIEALVHVGGNEAAEFAAVALADEDEGVRLAAVRTLSELAPDSVRAAGALKMALRSQEAAIRAAAIRGSSARGVPLDEEVAVLATDASPEVLAALFRAGAKASALGSAGRTVLLTHLSPALEHPDDEVVKAALAALFTLDASGLSPRLIDGLNHRAWDVRLDAARLLGSELARHGEGADAEAIRRALAARRATEVDDLVRAAIDATLSGWGAGRT